METHSFILAVFCPDGKNDNLVYSLEILRNGIFVGSPLDEDNESDLTDDRIEAWVNSLNQQKRLSDKNQTASFYYLLYNFMLRVTLLIVYGYVLFIRHFRG